MSSQRVAITGATGFVGRTLAARLAKRGIEVRAVTRNAAPAIAGVRNVAANVLDASQLASAFDGVEAVFHLAAHVHDVKSLDDGPQQRAITLGSTLSVLRAAEQAGVRTVILASSLAVFGDVGTSVVNEEHHCDPTTAYGRAKLESERALVDFTVRTGAFGAAIRPAMIYGVPCPGNLARMIRAVNAGWFPPLPEFGSRRSMVAVEDVAAAMELAWAARVPGGRPFIITDEDSYSTRQIYDMIRKALGRSESQWTIPRSALRAAAHVGDVVGAVIGRRAVFDSRILKSLSDAADFDTTRARVELGLEPTRTLAEVMPSLVRSVCAP
jgi:UDP-glucose 4-epimerase